jgi:hypothetical protein
MSNDPSRKHRPSRWIPIWWIAFSCALFILSLLWTSALNLAASEGGAAYGRLIFILVFVVTVIVFGSRCRC